MKNRVGKNLKSVVYGLRALSAYARGSERCPYPPTAIWLEPTDRCNLKCVMCPSRLRPGKERGFMELEVYRALIEEVSSFATTIYLFLGGEALLHKDLFPMIRLARSRGIAVRLNTNATLLDRERAEMLIDSGLDYLSFSFDGYNAETYERIRIGARFEPTLKNILDFLNLKKARGAKRPYTVLETIVVRKGKQPKEEELAFRELFRGLPLDEFLLREFHAWRGLFRGASEFQLRERGLAYMPCPYAWCAVGVLRDGTVVPCCLDMWGDYALGKAGEKPLLELWNGELMRDLRRKLSSGRHREIPLCAGCDILWADRRAGKFPHTLLNVALSLPAANLVGYRPINGLKRLIKGGLS